MVITIVLYLYCCNTTVIYVLAYAAYAYMHVVFSFLSAVTLVYTSANSIGMGARASHLYIWLGTGGGEHRELKNSKQETVGTALTITKTLTKTTNRTCTSKKVEGHSKKIFQRFAPNICPPTFRFVPAPMLLLICVVQELLVALGAG